MTRRTFAGIPPSIPQHSLRQPAGARGTGVSVIHNWNQIPHNKPVIVQKYIENPYLIDVTKFDLRVYILITSVHPLRLYVYSEGLVRFASDTYSPDTSTLSDKYVHLTNYSVNKKSSRYMVNQDPTACQGHKWTLSSLWNYLKARKVNVDGLWKKIVDIAIKTFLSGETAITRCNSTYLSSNYPSYELFGLDILLDADLNPWLLEVTKKFERVFPAIGMQKYYKFFSGPRYYNMLHEAWEKRYHKDRNEVEAP
ncbi:hypothetical protein J437_LFUL010490 [Ladona fulva]|uniref:Uncharacterized protein n=1 Tax=Ladona fulva TaxID=123851 RepID=A0A8K0P222_LADFU|nr:hypothetical protein J437_LFUL010490 [Ladona fulva]